MCFDLRKADIGRSCRRQVSAIELLSKLKADADAYALIDHVT